MPMLAHAGPCWQDQSSVGATACRCHALATKSAAADGETQALRQSLAQKTSQLKIFEGRLTSCQLELTEAQDKVRPCCVAGPLSGKNCALLL